MRTALFLFATYFAFPVSAETLKNHYNDPFIQVTTGIANCPQPKGPFMTLSEANAEAHPRIERGTTCFMSGKCREPNAYRYDPQIAETAKLAVENAVKKEPSLAKTSVWLTVQRRFIFAQGCVTNPKDVARWEKLLKRVPEVEYVSVDLAVGTMPKNGRMPYPTMP
jgi:hypothetical protein